MLTGDVPGQLVHVAYLSCAFWLRLRLRLSFRSRFRSSYGLRFTVNTGSVYEFSSVQWRTNKFLQRGYKPNCFCSRGYKLKNPVFRSKNGQIS